MKRFEFCRMGEVITVSVSIFILIVLVGYLAYNIIRKEPEYVKVEARASEEMAIRTAYNYIMPIQILNHSNRTINFIRFEVTSTNISGEIVTKDLDIEYLGSRSSRKVFVYYNHPIKAGNIKIAPVYYKLD